MRLFVPFSLAAMAVAGQLEPDSSRHLELSRQIRREQKLADALV